MTYSTQLKQYEDAVIQKRFEELEDDEVTRCSGRSKGRARSSNMAARPSRRQCRSWAPGSTSRRRGGAGLQRAPDLDARASARAFTQLHARDLDAPSSLPGKIFDARPSPKALAAPRKASFWAR